MPIRNLGSDLHISGKLELNKFAPGETVFDIHGSSGQLFSITDSLEGDLFSVNDISGLSILTVNSDDLVTINGMTVSDSFVKSGGLSTEFLKADGSVDTISYYHPGNLPAYDNYVSWNLKTNGIQRTTIQSGGTFDLVGGTNIGTSYGAGGVVTINNNLTNLNQLTTRNFSDLQLKPTTVGGYGITDAFTKTESNNNFLSITGQDNEVRTITIDPVNLPADYTKDDVTAYLNSIGITKVDIETLVVHVDEGSPLKISWVNVISTPTTKSGYGITDVYDKTESDGKFLSNTGGLMAGDIIPDLDNVHSLGSPTKAWRDLYVGPGSLYVNGKKVIEDVSDTMNITTSLDQNLSIKTSGVGTLQMSALGSGNVELNAVSGLIQLKGSVMFQAQKLIRTTDGTPLLIDDDINFSLGAGISSDLDVSGAVTGASFTKSGGLSTQFLKADGSVDSTPYYHSGNLPTYDNYGSWNLKSNGIQRTTIGSGGTLDLVAGTNMSISYSAGGIMTINSSFTNTEYTSSNGILLTGTNFTPTYGTAANTIAQGNDSRINNGQTAFGWGNHASKYVLNTGIAQLDPNTQLQSSSYRFDPHVNNPTNAHYAVSTYGNNSNVTGQLATHFSTGETYTRAYNTGWSAWRKIWDDVNLTNVSQLTNDAGYITEAADNQTLTFTNGDLSISAGNTVDLDSRFVKKSGDTMTGNLYASTTDKLGGFTVLPGGYVESNPLNFRFDESQTAYIGDRGGIITFTGASSPSNDNLKRLFTFTENYINLDTYKDVSNNVVIELTNISLSNSANTSWKPYAFFHAGAMPANIKIELKGGNDLWETAYDGVCSNLVTLDGFHILTQGTLKGARWTFTGISGASYLRMIGVIGKTVAPYQWSLLKSGGDIYGDVKIVRNSNNGSVPALIVGSGGNANIKTRHIEGKAHDSDINDTLHLNYYSGMLTSVGGDLDVTGNATATSFIKSGGTSSQFLKADGSVDTNTYLTAETDSQTLTFTNGDLSISNGNTVDLDTRYSILGHTHNSDDVSFSGNVNSGQDVFATYSNKWKSGYIYNGAINAIGSGNYKFSRVGSFTLAGLDDVSTGNVYISCLTYNGNTSWAKLWTDINLTKVSQLTNDAGYITEASDNQTLTFTNGDLSISAGNTVDLDSRFLQLTGGTLTGDLTTTSQIIIKSAAPQIKFEDNDGMDFWLHTNSNNFYILNDRLESGSWDVPYALQLEADTNKSYTFGNEIWHKGNLTNVSQLTNDAGYITEAQDNQTLTWNGGTGEISITGGNTIDIDGRYVQSVTPATPLNPTASIVGETIDISFSESTTTGVDNYLIFSSVAGGSYGLISIIPSEDFAPTISIIDTTFNLSGTIAYRIYAVKNGQYSVPATTSVAFTAPTLEPINLTAINLNKAFYIQWDKPDSRFVTLYNVYKHADPVEINLSRASATLIYSGNNNNYMYQIADVESEDFHQFWVEIITT